MRLWLLYGCGSGGNWSCMMRDRPCLLLKTWKYLMWFFCCWNHWKLFFSKKYWWISSRAFPSGWLKCDYHNSLSGHFVRNQSAVSRSVQPLALRSPWHRVHVVWSVSLAVAFHCAGLATNLNLTCQSLTIGDPRISNQFLMFSVRADWFLSPPAVSLLTLVLFPINFLITPHSLNTTCAYNN